MRRTRASSLDFSRTVCVMAYPPSGGILGATGPTFDDPVSNRSVNIRAVFRPHPPIGLLRGAPDVSSGEAQYPLCLLEQFGTDRARL